MKQSDKDAVMVNSRELIRKLDGMKPVQHILLLIAVVLVLLLPGTDRLPLLDRDEPRFAGATVEMMDRHEWIIPYFNHEYRFDKPVFTYWAMRAFYNIFGINELGARFHSVVSVLLLAVLVYVMGRRWFSASVGFLAAFGLVTSVQLIVNGRSCVADMPMILFVAASQFALFEMLKTRRPEKKWFWVLYLSLALGFLAKGPIALLVPAVSVLFLRFGFYRQPLPFQNLKLHFGIPLVLILIGLWGGPALILTQGQFWDQGINRHVVKRGLEVFNGRFYLPVFYPITAFISLFPWIAFMGYGFYAIRERRSYENACLLSWFVSPYLIFTFYATQLPHYVMPAFPAFFLMLAQAFEKPAGNRKWTRRLFVSVMALFAAVALIVLLISFIKPLTGDFAGLKYAIWGASLLLLSLVGMAVLVRKGRFMPALLLVIVIGFSAFSLGAGFRMVSPAVKLSALFHELPEDTKYLGYIFKEDSLVFYSRNKWLMTDRFEDAAAAVDKPGPVLLVMLMHEVRLDDYINAVFSGKTVDKERKIGEYRSEVDTFSPPGFSEIDISGANFGRTSWVNLKVLYRK